MAPRGWAPALPKNVRLTFKRLIVINTPAYYCMELIAVVSFKGQAPGVNCINHFTIVA